MLFNDFVSLLCFLSLFVASLLPFSCFVGTFCCCVCCFKFQTLNSNFKICRVLLWWLLFVVCCLFFVCCSSFVDFWQLFAVCCLRQVVECCLMVAAVCAYCCCCFDCCLLLCLFVLSFPLAPNLNFCVLTCWVCFVLYMFTLILSGLDVLFICQIQTFSLTKHRVQSSYSSC